MAITNERAEMLANYLSSDIDKAKELVEMSVEDATSAINADGYDFTEEEVKGFGDILQNAASMANEDGEIDAESLDNVAGGLVISGTVLTVAATLFLGGTTFGYTVARDRGW